MPDNSGIVRDRFNYGSESDDIAVTLSWKIINLNNYISSSTDLYYDGNTAPKKVTNPDNIGTIDELKNTSIQITSTVIPFPDIDEGTIIYTLTCGNIKKDFSNKSSKNDQSIYFDTTISIIK